MVLSNKEELIATCSCGCRDGVHLQIDKWDDEDIVFLSMVTDKFYAEQTTFFRRFVEKLKRVWFIIRSKEYLYFEIVMKKDDIQQFKEFVAKLP